MEVCVEKNAEIPAQAKYKGRVVFRGDNVKDEYFQKAMFQDMASCPATFEAAKLADMISCMPGCDGQQSDVDQAYTQTLHTGEETWVEIPRMQWPRAWHNKMMQKPVCRLLRALYGHPQAGALWEKHCDEYLKSIGWIAVENWPSTYYHNQLSLFLVVYVDDFKMAGPKDNLGPAWVEIRKGL